MGFFIPGWIVEHYPAMCEDIVRRGHEVGHHGYLHEKPFFLSGREEEEALITRHQAGDAAALGQLEGSGGQAEDVPVAERSAAQGD